MARTALRGLLLTLGLLGSLSVLPAQAGSLVWALHGPHSTLYLAGSVHLLPTQDAQLPPAFLHAYADSARLVMELDLGKVDATATADWMQQHGMLGRGESLRSVVGAQRYARLTAAATPLGLPVQLLETQAPWVVGLELAEVEYAHLGFDPQQGVEEQLVRRAQADGKPTAGLETLQEELGGLEALSREDQLRLLDQALDELNDAPEEEMHEVLAAWRQGDVPKLAQLLAREYADFPNLYRTLVSVRNERWLPQLKRLLDSPQNTLVVVGALHLVGAGGLLELLRRDGFEPQPVP
jgi:uncharacterized protein YbaP (TraB family)